MAVTAGRNPAWIVVLALLCAPALLGQSLGSYDADAERQIVRLLNQDRVQRGLQALQVDDRLTRAARQHSELMVQHQKLSHLFEGEEDELGMRLSSTGIHYDYCGENVARDSGGPAAAHTGLMNSPPHRENILSPDYNAIGIGVVRVGSILYVTEDFANRQPELSAAQAETQVARQINQLRGSGGRPALPVISSPKLHELACKMASSDSLNAQAAGAVKNVSRSVSYTTGDLTQMPPYVRQLGSVSASGMSVAACYASSRTNPNPLYWVIVVTYF